MTAQTPGEVNEQPWCFPTRFVLCRVLLPLILVSMASVQVKLLLQCAFPINRFVTHRAKKNPTKAGISYLVYVLLVQLSFAFVAPVHGRGNTHSNTSKRKPRQTKLYPVKASL